MLDAAVEVVIFSRPRLLVPFCTETLAPAPLGSGHRPTSFLAREVEQVGVLVLELR